MREGGLLSLFIITWTMVFTYIVSKIIVTYLSTQFSIRSYVYIQKSKSLRYRTPLSIYSFNVLCISSIYQRASLKVDTHLAAIPLLISLLCHFLELVWIMSFKILSLFRTFAIKGSWPEFFEAVLETSIIILKAFAGLHFACSCWVVARVHNIYREGELYYPVIRHCVIMLHNI